MPETVNENAKIVPPKAALLEELSPGDLLRLPSGDHGVVVDSACEVMRYAKLMIGGDPSKWRAVYNLSNSDVTFVPNDTQVIHYPGRKLLLTP